jgi:hypothetical protein
MDVMVVALAICTGIAAKNSDATINAMMAVAFEDLAFWLLCD